MFLLRQNDTTLLSLMSGHWLSQCPDIRGQGTDFSCPLTTEAVDYSAAAMLTVMVPILPPLALSARVPPGVTVMMALGAEATSVSTAVATGDVNRIKAVKGIGLKTAQKVIIELKDKIARGSGPALDLSSGGSGANTEEACSALVMLGFTKNAVEKAVASIVRKEPGLSLEDIIKKALKIL